MYNWPIRTIGFTTEKVPARYLQADIINKLNNIKIEENITKTSMAEYLETQFIVFVKSYSLRM